MYTFSRSPAWPVHVCGQPLGGPATGVVGRFCGGPNGTPAAAAEPTRHGEEGGGVQQDDERPGRTLLGGKTCKWMVSDVGIHRDTHSSSSIRHFI